MSNERKIVDEILAEWGNEDIKGMPLPSAHQIFDRVKVFLMPDSIPMDSFPGFPAKVIGIHFYPGKVKYDVELQFAGDFVSRVYNVDSVLVTKL